MVRIKGFRDIVTLSSLLRHQKTAGERGMGRISRENRVTFQNAGDWIGEAKQHLVAKAKPFKGSRSVHGWVWRSAIRHLLSFLEKELVEVGQFIQEGIPINPEEIPDLQNRISRLRKLLSR